jgi:hypothetical protein
MVDEGGGAKMQMVEEGWKRKYEVTTVYSPGDSITF